ncbi:ATV_collapsed_G0000760.mRNA.1.CDS.1 [Saccharomyces cerevisiae]|nr:ATV_collapsed_G0000760.mRNA.1.CDS.1 [Saccharomyces cerevisiae]
MISKFAFQCNEAATNLKLLEQGFKREDLAVTVLIDLPFEIIFGYYVVKWSSDKDPMIRDNRRLRNSTGTNKVIKFLVGDAGVLTPWLWGFLGRLAAAVLGSYVVKQFPKDGEISTGYFCLVIFQHLLGSFMNTVQFIGISGLPYKSCRPRAGWHIYDIVKYPQQLRWDMAAVNHYVHDQLLLPCISALFLAQIKYT